jgi:hypothetical protein
MSNHGYGLAFTNDYGPTRVTLVPAPAVPTRRGSTSEENQ